MKIIFNFQFFSSKVPVRRRESLSIFKNKKLIFFITLLATCYLLLATPVLAHTDGGFWRPGQPIVPCGRAGTPDCTQCELLHLVRHLIDFVMVAAAPILATVFFIIAGVYIMLGGANPGMLSTGKSMFKNTFIGLLIVMLAWLITNTLIQTLAGTDLRDQITGRVITENWWEFSCEDVGLDN